MMQSKDTIPIGLCQCGCGQKTNLSKQTLPNRGWVKGQPVQFIEGHNARRLAQDYAIVDAGYKTPCWEWLGSRHRKGYGQTERDGYWLAHVWMYEQRHGLGSAKPQLDHLCRNTPCVNPDHLEPVTAAENMRRQRLYN